jgi:hypothetical protein
MMKRREFINTTTKAALSMAVAPYILPTGRLFAPTGKRLANHVVFCLYAGGIRNFESIQKAEGNLMPHMLNGNESITVDILPAMEKIPSIDYKPIQQSGTLFKEFRYKSPKTIHYTGHAAAIMGVYSSNVQLMRPLNFPSVFEYYRKHNTPEASAANAWWISDQAGPFTFLNYSDYEGYGPMYGANMLQPTSLYNSMLNDVQKFSNEEYESISKLQAFFNKHAYVEKEKLSKQQIENTVADRMRMEALIRKLNNECLSPGFSPWDMANTANEDILTMYAAVNVLKEFKPELLVVNMQHSDIGHSNFSRYCNNMRKADYAVYQLWKTIQETPGLKDDTVLIIVPEFGRNSKPNTLIDTYGRFAVDHTGDENSQKIFCLIAGPENIVKQGEEINVEAGETIDVVPTVAKILGFYDDIPKGILNGRFLEEAFV